MPTGEGVTNSPSSPLISAMTPRKRRVELRALEVRLRHVDARLRDAALRPRPRCTRPPSTLRGPRLDRPPPRTRAVGRAASSSARHRVWRRLRSTHASRARDREARASRSESVELGLDVRRSRARAAVSPASTRSPSATGRFAIWPPSAGDKAGAAARVDGACAGVRDRRGDGAALGGDERHGDGLRPRDEPRAASRRRRAPR